MRTISVTFTDGTPPLVFDAESWNFHDETNFQFFADGKSVAVVPARNVRHFTAEETERDKIVSAVKGALIYHDQMVSGGVEESRVYDAAKVTVVEADGKYGSRYITILTPEDFSWVTESVSDHEAVRAVAIDVARERGYKTVLTVQRLGLTSDVESGRTSVQWRAQVA